MNWWNSKKEVKFASELHFLEFLSLSFYRLPRITPTPSPTPSSIFFYSNVYVFDSFIPWSSQVSTTEMFLFFCTLGFVTCSNQKSIFLGLLFDNLCISFIVIFRKRCKQDELFNRFVPWPLLSLSSLNKPTSTPSYASGPSGSFFLCVCSSRTQSAITGVHRTLYFVRLLACNIILK